MAGKKQVPCSKCGKHCNISQIGRHEKSCKGKFNNRGEQIDRYKVSEGIYECPLCGKKFGPKGIGTHMWRHSEEGKNHNPNIGYKEGSRVAWSKGLTKETSEIIREKTKKYVEDIKSGKIQPNKGRHHSEETKKLISVKRKAYLSANPEKVPYLLNHSSNGPSYPELYFMDVFSKEEIDLSYHKRVGLYELDFFNTEKMFCLEIDGEQHYLDPKILESDKKRTSFLEGLGWKVYRIRWAEFKKLSFEERHDIILDIKTRLV